jgi:hypothetical protein
MEVEDEVFAVLPLVRNIFVVSSFYFRFAPFQWR